MDGDGRFRRGDTQHATNGRSARARHVRMQLTRQGLGTLPAARRGAILAKGPGGRGASGFPRRKVLTAGAERST